MTVGWISWNLVIWWLQTNYMNRRDGTDLICGFIMYLLMNCKTTCSLICSDLCFTERLFQCLMSNKYGDSIGLTLDIEKSLGEIKILPFYKVFNSLSLCFVYLVLFYKPFKTFIIYFTCIVSLYRNDPTPRKIDRWLVLQTLHIHINILEKYINNCTINNKAVAKYWQ